MESTDSGDWLGSSKNFILFTSCTTRWTCTLILTVLPPVVDGPRAVCNWSQNELVAMVRNRIQDRMQLVASSFGPVALKGGLKKLQSGSVAFFGRQKDRTGPDF